MSKKAKTVGRTIKTTPSQELAVNHDKDTKVIQPQISLNDQYGLIYFGPNPIYWFLHYKNAKNAFKRLGKYQDRILHIPIGKDNSRHIYDIAFLCKVYRAGFELVVNTYLTFEQLSLDILRKVYYGNDPKLLSVLLDRELKDKLTHIINVILKEPKLREEKGYEKLFEYETKRHSFNHPTCDNTYNCSQYWDNVPLAWIIARKYEAGFESIEDLLEKILNSWTVVKKEYDSPVTLTNIKRGIKSLHSYKKSPEV